MTTTVTLITTLGKLEGYRPARYRFGGKDLGEATIPATVLARHFQPEHIVLLCPGEAVETADWFAEELAPAGLPKPVAHPLPIPHESGDIPALIGTLAALLDGETRAGRAVHLDFSFGLRSITVLALLTSELLTTISGGRIERVTCINFEAPRDPGGPAEILDATPYLHLGRLRSAVDGLERHGDIDFLARTIAGAFPGALTEKELDEAAELHRRLSLLRTRQATSKGTGRGIIRRLQSVLRDQAARLPLLGPIADRVAQHLAPLDPGDRNSLSPFAIARLARWYYEHGQAPLALLLVIQAADVYSKIPLAAGVGDTAANFYRGEKEHRNTLAHADLSASIGAAPLSHEDIDRIVSRFETLCQSIEAASPAARIDALVARP